MQDLVPGLTPIKEQLPQDATKQSSIDDDLGRVLQNKWVQWSTIKRYVEEQFLEFLRAYNQQNETEAAALSKFHHHIYIGTSRTKANSAFSRISDLISAPHWSLHPTPIPEDEANNPANAEFIDAMKAKAEAMQKEIEDQLIDLGYKDKLNAAILEACILGTGCIKGIIPGVKTAEAWHKGNVTAEWDIKKTEMPFPQMSHVSVFDCFPDPYANCVEDMSGHYERHVMNRIQFEELKLDTRFNKQKIDEILAQTDRGNHAPLWHETIRRNIAKITDSTAVQAERYDVLEYWGQISGRLLTAAGIEGIEETETRWCNVWTCSGKALFAQVMPMKKQRIPYNYFQYTKVPHQFWGVGPVQMGMSSQLGINGVVRSILDGMAMVAVPMAEVNVNMLKEGQDPNVMLPGMTWLRDNGDPSVPAVRFFQPNVPTGQLISMGEMFKSYADDETALPAYTYGNQGNEVNKTAQGMSMQMGAASLPIKSVVKNLEDFCIRPFITSAFDWNMQWSDKEDIKGDMQINVLGTSALMAKETKSQQLMQFLNITANPLDMKYVDRKYLLTEIAKSMEIDTTKAVPDQMPQEELPEEQGEQISPVDQAKVGLIQVQAQKEAANVELVKAQIDKTVAETANKNVATEFSAMQASQQVVMNPLIVPVADSIMQSAGFKDHNEYPSALVNQPVNSVIDNIPSNTSPQFPALPEQAEPLPVQLLQEQELQSPNIGAEQGIETSNMQD